MKLILSKQEMEEQGVFFSPRALIIVPRIRGVSTRKEFFIGRGTVLVINGGVWNGSYHDPHYWGNECNALVAYMGKKRGGWLGKFRSIVRKYLEQAKQEAEVSARIRAYRGRQGD